MRIRPISAAAVLAFAGTALADEVVLKNGAVLEGLAKEEGDKVVVEMDAGSMTLKRSDVSLIRKVAGPLQELEARLEKPLDAEGNFQAATWAREKGLVARSTDLYRKVLLMNPDHEGARKALGYTKHEGRWLTEEELLEAKGYVRHEGRWVTREERERLLEAEERRRLAELQRQAAEEALEFQRELQRMRMATERTRAILAEPQFAPWVRAPWRVGGWIPLGQPLGQTLPLSGIPQPLPLSGVPQPLPLSGIPQALPLAGD